MKQELQVPLDRLPWPGDEEDLTLEDVGELARSMETFGLLQPIGVRRQGAGWQVVFGRRRVHAARILGWPTIPAREIDVPQRAVHAVRLAENMQRVPLDLEALCVSVVQLADEGFTTAAIAELFGQPVERVSLLLRMARNELARALMTERRIEDVRAWEFWERMTNPARRIVLNSTSPITALSCEIAMQQVAAPMF